MNMRKIDILLVEDRNEDAELAVRALWREHLASNIFIAKDGEEALDVLFCRGAFAERSFDHLPKLVLLNLKLPRIDGMEVLRQLKADSRTRSIPVIILGSSRQELELARSYDLGANCYIQKSTDFTQSRLTVKTVGAYWMDINRRPLVECTKGSTAKGPS